MAPSLSVAEYFAGKSIFITGATGFMGKVLIEKLLRTCPELNKIYLLMRGKKGHNSRERLDEFLKVRVFDRLQKESPKRLEKLRVVPGDILSEGMGISIEDREELQRECQIIFHCAACVRFDMFLRDAVKMNTAGTKKVLELAEGVKNLEVFVHVSTSYCRCEVPLLEERLYPAKHRPEHVMHCASWMDDELLEHLQPKIIEPQPNTYAYTKNLTEDLVSQYQGKFPIVIARPSIVTAAFKEPMPGWVDNLNGPTGLLVGAGKGVIRTMHCNEEYLADVVPVDMAVNACILLAYTTGMDKFRACPTTPALILRKCAHPDREDLDACTSSPRSSDKFTPEEIRICNVTQSEINPISWGQALDMGRVHVQEFPFSVCLWYPGGSPKSSWLQHQLAVFFMHLLPAYFVDLLMFLMGKKTFMVKMQKRINYGLEVLQYYTTKEWHFKNDNFLALQNTVSEEDNKTFYTDINIIKWSSYIRDYIKGAREYCCKEDPSTLPQARRLNRQLYYLDKVMQVVVCSFIAYFIYYYVRIILPIIFQHA